MGEKGIGKGRARVARHQVLCPKELYSWQDGVRELHIDWWVKVVPASPKGPGGGDVTT